MKEKKMKANSGDMAMYERRWAEAHKREQIDKKTKILNALAPCACDFPHFVHSKIDTAGEVLYSVKCINCGRTWEEHINELKRARSASSR